MLSDLLGAPQPGALLRQWHAEGVLATLLPEVDCLFGIPQRPEYHPEVDTGEHIALCLDAARGLGASPAVMFAVLTHDLGKGLTPKEDLPGHPGHETRGLDPVSRVAERFQVPLAWQNLALLVCEFHLHAHRTFEMRPKSVLKYLEVADFADSPEQMADFVLACHADKRGRLGREACPYPQGEALLKLPAALASLAWPEDLVAESREGQALHRARLAVVTQVLGAPH